MTAKPKPPRTCDECKYDGGIHYDPDDPSRWWFCPNKKAAELLEQAKKLTESNREQAKEAAHRIIADAAARHYEFSANDIREELEAAQIPGSLVGGAFQWAKNAGLIVKTDRRVMSNEDTTRHPIDVWRAVKHKGSAA